MKKKILFLLPQVGNCNFIHPSIRSFCDDKVLKELWVEKNEKMFYSFLFALTSNVFVCQCKTQQSSGSKGKSCNERAQKKTSISSSEGLSSRAIPQWVNNCCFRLPTTRMSSLSTTHPTSRQNTKDNTKPAAQKIFPKAKKFEIFKL